MSFIVVLAIAALGRTRCLKSSEHRYMVDNNCGPWYIMGGFHCFRIFGRVIKAEKLEGWIVQPPPTPIGAG